MPTIALDANAVTAFLLVLARTSAWTVTAPVIAARGLPGVARVGLAVALATFLTPLAVDGPLPSDFAGFVSAAAVQVTVGLALGFLTGLLLTAVETAGAMADYASGFSFGALVDPVSGSQATTFARLANVSFAALLFATDAYQTLVAGFARSFRALPLDAAPALTAGGIGALAHATTGVLTAALEIGAPLLGVLFLTEVTLAMATRFVPQANMLSVGLPLKAMVALTTAGTMLAFLPSRLPGLLDLAQRLTRVVGA